MPSCTKPIDADFSGQTTVGLADDEMLWIQQIHREPSPTWIPKATAADSSKISTFNLPVFEQVLPEIIRDLFSGELNAYEDYQSAEEEKKIENFDELVKGLQVSKKDFSALTHVFEVFSVVKSRRGKYTANHNYLRLIWRDPEGKVPDRKFCTVKLDEIRANGDYPIQVSYLEATFLQYLDVERFVFFPSYVRDNRLEYSIQSPEEAVYLRDKVMDGHWNQVMWVEGKVNISGKEKIELNPEDVMEFAGVYNFPAALSDSSGKPKDLYLTAESDYLIADWSHRFRIEKILPYMENAFFSTNGEVYVFDFEGDDYTGDLYLFSKTDTLLGQRIQN